MPRGRVADPCGLLAHLCVGFTPQRKSVGMLAGDLDRTVGCAADEDPDALRPIELHMGKAILHLIVFADIIERLVATRL